MPWTSSNGVRIYWEEEGSGHPLLMIMGLSFSLAMWGELRPFLAQNFRTILFDNRCVGSSDSPLPPFSLATMAQDAIAVMDAAGVSSAHVLGVSMGGMIAQELALMAPDRVDRLTLGCTHCGGLQAVRAEWSVLYALASPLMLPETKLRRIVPYIYDRHTPLGLIEQDLAIVRRHAPTMRGFLQQLAAIVGWHSWTRLPQIKADTLVIHGENDLLIPVQNARILAERIPNSRLAILPQASHIFPTDQPDLTRNVLCGFLTGCTTG
jgi:pimeloyl-ACP methyl ester carboxylesterase